MKKLLLFLLLVGESALAQTSETEPNNSFNQANALELGTEQKGTIPTGGDLDYFKLTVAKPGVLNVAVENVPASIQPYVEIFDGTQKKLETGSGNAGTNTYIDARACAPGTYYVLMASYYNNQKSNEPYTLKVTLDAADAYECNNSFTEAKEIQSAQNLRIAINDEGDVDFFKINVKRGGVLRVSAENVPKELSPYLEIHDPFQKRLVSGSGDAGSNTYLDKTVCSPGMYYVTVQGYYNYQKSLQPFDFKITLDTADVYECNGTFTEAKEIKSGQRVKIAIGDEQDVDFFKINVTKPGVLNVGVENVPKGINPQLQVYSGTTQRLDTKGGQDGTNTYVDQLVCTPGTYYVIVGGYYNSEKSATLMDLRVTLDDSDAYECNNSFSDSKTVEVGSVIQATLNDEDDVDYFKFSVPTKTTLNVRMRNLPGGLDPVLRIYNGAQNQLYAAGTSEGKSFEISKKAYEAGTYYVKIEPYYYYSPQPYTLEIARDTVLPPTLKANVLSVCPGGEARLTAEGCLGVVKWSNNQTGLSITVKPTANTTYTAVCEDGGRTSANSQPLVITMKPVPTATASATNGGKYYETQTIELSAGGGGTYAWTGPLNFKVTQQNPKILNANVNMTGTYQVAVTNTEGCSATAGVNVKVELITALEPTTSGMGLRVAPNPAPEACRVRLELATPAPALIRLLDARGRVVATWVGEQPAPVHETELSLRGLPTGMYLLQAQTAGQILVKKLFKGE